MNSQASEHMNRTSSPISSGSAKRFIGTSSRKRCTSSAELLAAADERGDKDVFDFDLTQPTLLLAGSEGAGLSAAWRELADVVVRIPMAGAASSLNVASATTAVLYEAARQRLLARKADELSS